MESDTVVIIVEKGYVSEVYSGNAGLVVRVIDLDMKRIGEQYISEFTWPETQFDEDKINERTN